MNKSGLITALSDKEQGIRLKGKQRSYRYFRQGEPGKILAMNTVKKNKGEKT
jgi:hypothetical protein